MKYFFVTVCLMMLSAAAFGDPPGSDFTPPPFQDGGGTATQSQEQNQGQTQNSQNENFNHNSNSNENVSTSVSDSESNAVSQSGANAISEGSSATSGDSLSEANSGDSQASLDNEMNITHEASDYSDAPASSAAALFTGLCQSGVSAQGHSAGAALTSDSATCTLLRQASAELTMYSVAMEMGDEEAAQEMYESALSLIVKARESTNDQHAIKMFADMGIDAGKGALGVGIAMYLLILL